MGKAGSPECKETGWPRYQLSLCSLYYTPLIGKATCALRSLTCRMMIRACRGSGETTVQISSLDAWQAHCSLKTPQDAASEDDTILRGPLIRVWRSPHDRWKADSHRSTQGFLIREASNHTTVPLKNFMPYRNYPVVGEGPFNVIVAFCLELHVVHTSRLQTNPGVTSLERGLSHAPWAEPTLTEVLTRTVLFCLTHSAPCLRPVNLLKSSFKKHPDEEIFIWRSATSQSPFSFFYPRKIKCGLSFQNCEHNVLLIWQSSFLLSTPLLYCTYAPSDIWNDTPKRLPRISFLGNAILGLSF